MMKVFGVLPSGQPVHAITLQNAGLCATFITYGATLQDLRIDRLPHSLVVGSDEIQDYLGPLRHAGALVGRFANRIKNAQFQIDGQIFQGPKNSNDRNMLHGGPDGTSYQIWNVDASGQNFVKMSITLTDGHMGFPGNLTIVADIRIDDEGALVFDITAQTDKPTPCSIAHHSYFNLDGSADINEHMLAINADGFLPVDADLIPLGHIDPVKDHAFDFRKAREINDTRIDHNFCLNQGDWAARLICPSNGLCLQVTTNHPGLQVYTGDGMAEKFGARHGIALETQHWPDAPNRPDFPSAILRPGATYHHQATYHIIKTEK